MDPIPSSQTGNLNIQSAFEAKEVPKFSDMAFQCTAVETAVFSRPPFGEEWSIEGERIEGLLRIPEVTNQLLKLLHEKGERRITDNNFGEIWAIDRKAFLEVASQYFSSVDFEKMIYSKWISLEEVAKVKQCILRLQTSENPTITITTEYPTLDLLNTFQREIEDPNSLIMLGGYNQEGDEFSFVSVSAENPQTFKYPRAVARIRSINPLLGGSVSEVVSDEIAHYITTEEQRADLFSKVGLSNNLSTDYLADIGKVNIIKGQQVLPMVAQEYFNSKKFGDFGKMPKQLVYFTLKKTPIGRFGLKLTADALVQDFGAEYVEKTTSTIWSKNGEQIEFVLGTLTLNINPQPDEPI